MKKNIILLFMISFYILGIDTTETFEIGYSDFEIYHNISDFKKDLNGDITFGVGLTSYLSSSFSVSATKDGNSFSYGMFSTIFDSKYFDIDLYYSFDNNMIVSIGNEINLDLANNLDLAGIYIKNEYSFDSNWNYFLAIGSYYKINTNLAFLLEIDLLFTKNDISKTTLLGINYLIKENIELISEYSFDLNEKSSNLSIGFIFTI